MKKKMNRNKLYDHIQGYTFISPAIVLLAVFVYISIVVAIYMSFNEVNLFRWTFDFVGFNNYKRIFTEDRIFKAFSNTTKFVAVVAPMQTVLALILAAVLNSKIRAQKAFRIVYFLPTLTSSTALTMIFMFIFSISGPYNTIGKALGFVQEATNWLNEPKFALKIIMCMNIWSTVPYYMTIYLSALQDVPASLYEAAEVDGANAVLRFLNITVPHMKPITSFVFITGIIGTFQMFDQAYIFSNGSGGPQNSTLTVALMVYQYAFSLLNDMGLASAVAIVLSIVIIIASALANKLNKSEKLYS
ncbi:MAG: sugar ABC transporter permease [Clostridiaceae bacterium]|jgi:multiple sugar transport system permease protein|nr:sugar ABC transporter permease [Clostridiaceae bacterium]